MKKKIIGALMILPMFVLLFIGNVTIDASNVIIVQLVAMIAFLMAIYGATIVGGL